MATSHHAAFDEIVHTYRHEISAHQRRWDHAVAQARQSTIRPVHNGQPLASESPPTRHQDTPQTGSIRRIVQA